jgi:hypothetical protein
MAVWHRDHPYHTPNILFVFDHLNKPAIGLGFDSAMERLLNERQQW